MINFGNVNNGLQWVSLNSKKAVNQPEAPAAKAAVETGVKAQPSSGLMKLYFAGADEALQIAKTSMNKTRFDSLNEVLSFDDYVREVYQNPRIAQNAYQRLYDMVFSQGVEPTGKYDPYDNDEVMTYNFFSNPRDSKKKLVGQDVPVHRFAKMLEGAAKGGEIGNRVTLIVGPVGSGKSFMLDLVKRGLENYSKTEQGKLYALRWANLPEEVAEKLKLTLADREADVNKEVGEKMKDVAKRIEKKVKSGEITQDQAEKEALAALEMANTAIDNNTAQVDDASFIDEPMNTDPLYVLSSDPSDDETDTRSVRQKVVEDLNETFTAQNDGKPPYQIGIQGDLPPVSDLIRETLREYYAENSQPGEDIDAKVLEHVQARRIVFDETKGVGVATYQPKDEKNQDSTELSGGIDFMKLLKYGDPTHPLARSYRGELQKANRGLVHMEEGLKLQKEFQYDFLTVGQERKIKPKDASQIFVDLVMAITTNEPEFEKLQKDPTMEALQIRFFTVMFPYLKNYKVEQGIYMKDDISDFVKQGGHIDPYAMEIASLWSVATRLVEDKTKNLTQFEKAKLYAGEAVGAYDPDDEMVYALEAAAGRSEGHHGVSPRIIQNAISNALSHQQVKKTGVLTAPLLLKSLRKELKVGTINEPKKVPEYLQLLEVAEGELIKNITTDVFRAYYKTVGKNELMSNLNRYRRELLTWDREHSSTDEPFMNSIEQYFGKTEQETKAFRETLIDRLNAQEDLTSVLLENETISSALLNNWMKNEMLKFIQTAHSDEEVAPLVSALEDMGYSEFSAKRTITSVREQMKAAAFKMQPDMMTEMMEELEKKGK